MDKNSGGTLYFDDFESHRFSYIGTLTDPGVDDPQATNPPGWFTRTYQYSATIPHAVSSVTSEQSSVDSYEYDLNGNMTCRVENGVTYSQTYNAENRISSIAKRTGDCATGTILESWSFAYDGDGVRVMTAHFTGTSGTPDSTTSYFMGGQFEVKDGATKKYYSIAGMMVAVNDGTGLQYLLTDHLGSTVAVTNQAGTLTSQQRYLPFGAPRTIPNSPIAGTDFTYTGQRKLDDGMGGIMDYRARFYSPALMRFLQPDSIIPNPVNPQAYNRYTYVLNAPIRFNDPTGNMHLCGVQIPEEDCQDESPAPVPPLGGGGGGGDDDCDLDCDLDGGSGGNQGPGHYYTVDPWPVCLDWSWINCTDGEVEDYLSRWQYPGQLFWQPVRNGDRYNVFPEKIGNLNLIGLWYPGSGAIRVAFGDHTMTNIAFPSHIFYEGYVERSWFRDGKGVPYVTTLGEGTNDGFPVILSRTNNETNEVVIPGAWIDAANEAVGPYAFEAQNAGLILYTTVVETGQYISSLLP